MKLFSFLPFLFIASLGFSQQIGGVINTYTPVISFGACQNKIIVEDASTFNTGDTVLITQMKGAIIDSSNTSNFGTITDYKNAGNYEFNYVKSKSGNIIELKNNLTRQYDIPAGKVQLVRVPYYRSATVTFILTCLPWDGTKGGILAFNVKDTLYLNSKIDISGKGFWGGKVINPRSNLAVCHQDNFYYSNDPTYASPKGEGITLISDFKSFGRGPLANGGGGGTGHNSGGGGGSAGTPGGNGGKEWISCNPISYNGGSGGKVLPYSNIENKIFLGGGGGAGHCDNLPGFNSEGGNGGGIIIVQTNFLKANNNAVISNGASGAECIQDFQQFKCHEGMGGGGGGGTILIKANVFLDNLPVSVNGGKGADMNGEAGVGQLGPGGGGSGGILWLSNNVIPAEVSVSKSGGINGTNINYGNDSYGAISGSEGTTLFNLQIPTDDVLFVAGACGIVPVTLTTFEASIISTEIKLNWTTEIEDGVRSFTVERSLTGHSDFISLGTIAAGSVHSYSFIDNRANANQNYFYRLRILENNGAVSYSEIKKIKINAENKLTIIYPNPSNGTITVRINGYTGKAKFTVMNSVGQAILKEDQFITNNNGVPLKLNKQSKGIYWIKIETNNEESVERIIIF